MAETDAGKVRESLVHLTTQYQSQQIDAARFQEGINALKSNYSPLSSAINGFDKCYDYYTERDPCLEVVQLGKTHVVPSQPLTDKEIFFRGMYPHIKSPEEKKAFRELVQFSDEHGIPYSEYFTLLENALRKLTSEEITSFEENVSRFNPHTFLLQCTLYAAMYALNKAPPLTTDQLSRAPEGLRLYYNGFEQTVLGHVERWEIMPAVGDPQNDMGGAAAEYDPRTNQLFTAKYLPFPSLFDPFELNAIYHELFHAYQDSRAISQCRVHVEHHANLIGTTSVLRLESKRNSSLRRPFKNIKEEAVSRLRQINNREGLTDVIRDREKILIGASYSWDWAAVIYDNIVDPNLNSKRVFLLQERIEESGLVVYNSAKSRYLQQIQTNFNRIPPWQLIDFALPKLDQDLQALEVTLNEVYVSLGIDLSVEDKDGQVQAIMKKLFDEFMTDDIQYSERIAKHKTQYTAIRRYFENMARQTAIYEAKIYLLRQKEDSEALALEEKLAQYKEVIIKPMVFKYLAVFTPDSSNGIK